jgi:hypothetical protein
LGAIVTVFGAIAVLGIVDDVELYFYPGVSLSHLKSGIK